MRPLGKLFSPTQVLNVHISGIYTQTIAYALIPIFLFCYVFMTLDQDFLGKLPILGIKSLTDLDETWSHRTD